MESVALHEAQGTDPSSEPLLRAENLTVEYRAGGKRLVHAVSDVSFKLAEGETLGLVGETGCGKTSLGRAIVQMPRPTVGRVFFQGQDLVALSERKLRPLRPKLTMILQNPIASLNPRRTVEEIVGEPLAIWRDAWAGGEKDALIDAALQSVELNPDAVRQRRAREFSGGQCQRIAIARALVLRPRLMICDEPVSALDVSVQASILNLLEAAKQTYGLTLLFISHDLAVVKNISDRIAVMYLGKICEVANADDLYESPCHPYTAALIDAIPGPAKRRTHLNSARGEIPSPMNPPSGCRFRTRCPIAQAVCGEQEPPLAHGRDGRLVACHFPLKTSER